MHSNVHNILLGAAAFSAIVAANPVALTKRGTESCGLYASANMANLYENEENLRDRQFEMVPVSANSCNRIGCVNTR